MNIAKVNEANTILYSCVTGIELFRKDSIPVLKAKLNFSECYDRIYFAKWKREFNKITIPRNYQRTTAIQTAMYSKSTQCEVGEYHMTYSSKLGWKTAEFIVNPSIILFNRREVFKYMFSKFTNGRRTAR